MLRNLRAKSDFQHTTLRNQLTSLVLYEVITTTLARAKKLETFANKFFSRVRLDDLNSKKFAHEVILDKNATKKIFEEILPRFNKTETTFVKYLKSMPRKGDNAPMAIVQIVKTLQETEKTTPSSSVENKDSVTVTKRTRKKT
jgi:large subunit ribosomal protein L17